MSLDPVSQTPTPLDDSSDPAKPDVSLPPNPHQDLPGVHFPRSDGDIVAEDVGPTWEDDENPFTGGTRAAVTLLAGAMLAYAQWNANIDPATISGWGRWVGNSVLCNLLLPLGIVWFFFAQTLTHQDWLKDQKHNGWNFGWNFAQWHETELGSLHVEFVKFDLAPIKKALRLGAMLWVPLLPFLWYFSHQPAVRATSLLYIPHPGSTFDWIFILGTLIIYMFCWEWFFRGFLLFGMAQGFTVIPAVLIQAAIFGLAHFGKSDPEYYSSYAGGLLLGVICWREKSFLPAFFAHALVHVTWAVFLLT